jgi:hypothetical protein
MPSHHPQPSHEPRDLTHHLRRHEAHSAQIAQRRAVDAQRR